MLVDHSPEKENRSPSPSRQYFTHKKANKDSKVISELLDQLKSLGVTIPSIIDGENKVDSIKLIDINQNQNNCLKAKLADR